MTEHCIAPALEAIIAYSIIHYNIRQQQKTKKSNKYLM